ncbi:prolyl oligopeptidase family serine peptidase [Microbacterium sp. EYE_5]|uniref:prolyl oligopeptidase family serine peptidase n=1 Tax=unclassified Microbacterium TaxID=2609290 RepID=UPI00200523CF|nr:MULTISPECIES: prolyl oligopeptidase family serine peptidase [unclassified Microbacterium]MCK6080041.1 prolyl oligopeptidase family serine peptidase [Microbacterium sp. EYE_382]MCK6085312.1 prolyl oligopeptidase family serine peptidase [Microbacterium sp. EYE_384]MCK6122463.1 prolyl oligopeptidase family serine peptidase [Microbacterium sp. EYE_80]MCK6126075.1 prolyl oligopeptidase family serine peptidase [Microbacterium sp. EYE_79]MCK6140996.1 prolyl oligopeptidase family serine peptidase [
MSAAETAPEPADPFLWLEDVDGPAARAWAADRTAETERTLAGPDRDALEDRLTGILQDPDRLVVPSRHGDLVYDLWRDADNPRGLWRRSALAAFRDGAPKWETLLDVDALGRDEGTSWAFAGATHAPTGSGRALVRLSPDGGDAAVVREFDLETLRFVDDRPFTLAADKHRVAWIDVDTLLVATALHGGGVTDSGYPISARAWRRGESLDDAPPIVMGVAGDVGVFAHVDHTGGSATPVVIVAHDFFHSEAWIWDGHEPRLLAVPQDAHADVHGDLVAVRTTTPWRIGGTTHPAGTLLVGPVDTVTTGDASELRVAFAPTSTSVLETWSWTRNRLVLTILDRVRSRLASLDPHTFAAVDLDLGLGDADLFSANVAALDPDEDDELWVLARGFLTPPTLLVLDAAVHPGTDAAASAPRIVDRSHATFDTDGLVAEQHWATSADGTRIPYFEVGPRERDGVLPVLMSGYGGFEHALTPEYPTIVGPAWLEQGRVFVVANIRGGGEFGPQWHLAALREHRHRAYEDFAAVARDLVARGVSTADRIACHGRSNGGLLVGNMLTQYPDDFGAVVCGVPLLDMRRYTRLSAGASWIAEYGDPDDPAQWEYVKTFSPYHLIEPGRRYPASLIYAAASDDRVGPVQARKMAARMADETDAEVHYLEPVEGGHAGAIDARTTAALHATIHAFLERTVARGA